MELTEHLQNINIVRQLIHDNGIFPNNGLLPLLHYQNVISATGKADIEAVREHLETNSWTDSWVNGVYDYQHYHSTAHEVLIVIRGSARIQFGGDDGNALLIETGDAVVIPAGVAHKAVDVYDNFQCIGAYPVGQTYDIMTKKEDRERAIHVIKALPLPVADPLYGTDGPLIANWTR